MLSIENLLNTQNYGNLSQEQKEALVKLKLIKYLPAFVDLNSQQLNICLIAIAKRLVELYDKIYSTKEQYNSGKSLRLHADKNKIFYKNSYTDSQIRTRTRDKVNRLNKRATEAGIVADIEDQNAPYQAVVEFLSGSMGWILDVTYPEVTIPKKHFLDTYKAVKLNYQRPFAVGYGIIGEFKVGQMFYETVPYVKNDTENTIIPIDVTPIYE